MCLAFFLCLVTTSQAAVYRWQDSSGNTKFGDQPPAGVAAEQVELPELSTYAPPPVPEEAEPVAAPAAATGAVPAQAQRYSRMVITQP
ncbi:MAG: DUF4124 domain-containing protein, partial [Gammaproteobacteria bacterium]